MRWVFAIADDLTGALETGAKFQDAVVTTDRVVARAPESGVLVIDTETRHLPAHAAAEVVLKTVRSARPFEPWLIYKKTDSTLRGNIAAELGALMSAFPERRLVYVPAYPEMGRTVRGGHLLVDGIPVHQTAFANDPLNPVLGSHIAGMLEGIEVTVFDGETVSDVQLRASEILGEDPPPLAAGPAALAGCLSAKPVWAMPNLPRCLVVNGSMHPVSAAQIERACANGVFDENWLWCDRSPESVRGMLAQGGFDGLIVFGGDTAYDIHRALGAPDFRTCGEVIPGVPLSRCGDLFWVTKAGGFGAPDLLGDLRRRLT